MKALLVLLPVMLLPLGGCSAPTSAGAEDEPVVLSFQPRKSTGDTPERPTLTARGGSGRVEVGARLSTPTPCYTLAGTANRDAATLTLRVVAQRTGDICAQVIQAWEYDAVLTGVPAATYTLRVTHEFPGTGQSSPTVVLEQSVRVE